MPRRCTASKKLRDKASTLKVKPFWSRFQGRFLSFPLVSAQI